VIGELGFMLGDFDEVFLEQIRVNLGALGVHALALQEIT
jgi:hypothetical protein